MLRTTLKTCLWKEWRDQRRGLSQMLLVWCGLAFALSFVLPRSLVDTGWIVSATTTGGMLLTMVLLVGDGLSRDVRGSSMAMLQRMPSGLAIQWFAKLALLTASLIAVTTAAWCTAKVSSAIVAPHLVQPGFLSRSGIAPHLFLVLGAGAWAMSMATWLRNGYLALVIGTALTIPFLMWNRDLHYGLAPILHSGLVSAELATFGFFLVGLLAASWSYLGLRFGRPTARRRSLLTLSTWGLPIIGVLLYSLSPAVLVAVNDGMQISRAAVGVDGRMLFVTTRRDSDWPVVSIVHDTQTGSWRTVGRANQWVYLGSNHGTDTSGSPLVGLGAFGGVCDLLDGRTGQLIARQTAAWPPPPATTGLRAERLKCETRRHLPNGEQIWIAQPRQDVWTVMRQDRDGRVCERFRTRLWPQEVLAGFAMVFRSSEKTHYTIYDALADKVFTLATRRGVPRVTAAGWLLHKWPGKDRSRIVTLRIDPETESSEPYRWLEQGETIADLLGADHALVRRDINDDPAIFYRKIRHWRVNLHTGERLPVLSFDGSISEACLWRVSSVPDVPLYRAGQHKLVWLAPGSRQLSKPIAYDRALDVLDNRWLYIISRDQRRIEKIDLTTHQRTTIWPPAE